MHKLNMHKLEVLRKAAGLTGAELAERAGVSRKTIYGIERREPKRTHVIVALRLSEALGCEVEDIFTDDEVTHRGRPP